MEARVTPMIHVRDVRATVEWYVSIGFRVLGTAEDGEEMDWAEVAFGAGRVMFSAGGGPGSPHRREVDLYVHTGDVDGLAGRLAGVAEVVEAPHDTFYGMRELIVRDLNGFWITFGEPAARPEADA
jgi:catechol 2,3-dioxygenase-like lactoylglutathione lyase family enzyme